MMTRRPPSPAPCQRWGAQEACQRPGAQVACQRPGAQVACQRPGARVACQRPGARVACQRPGARVAAAAVAVFALAAAPSTVIGPRPAQAQDVGTLAEDNARLRAENERLRSELEALRGAARSGPTVDAGPREPAAAQPLRASEAPATRVASEFVPSGRISLTVQRDEAGDIRAILTPWYRTTDDASALTVRESLQFRAVPARPSRPEQVWMHLSRPGTPRTVSSDTTGTLQLDDQSLDAPLAQHEVSRQARRRHQKIPSSLRDELAIFALPPGALEKIAITEQGGFNAGPIQFTFTDEHVTAAAALAARLKREEESSR